ncbi:Protein kinase superfamily protein [Raphanus sativus]|uniref:Probable serine/threonine-protein kinase PBL20 n=1 Tax=Raphanus sativus TaxID=3726 RepID=A0A6J0KN84_RAPSA|nr:probable serine/threonine-protein kinase PBL20 [Raphanus sativus]XP_056857001.1 probable serine/threonine-protein kinase PBL20 [Raphanus sativus]KAJ4867001.1 Protein kinase superfamily protein [Raphanus sativus]KAJ4881062.1 Protein kinase superfamily protein [Raphanus sativus]
MNCLFMFKSKKPKSRRHLKKESKDIRGRHLLQKSAPELSTTGKNQTTSTSFNLPTPRSLPSPTSVRDLYTEREQNQNLRVFSYMELSEATCGFDRKLQIGEGGFGNVYKATINNLAGGDSDSVPLTVAVKRLKKQSQQGHKQWLAEVQLLGVVNHPNVVKLLGYCSEDTERLLVYELMSNLSLEDHLFTRRTLTLPWKQRLEIMLGAAQGLAYLHEIQVIYRDFKSSNVLLDDDFNQKLSDFGLAREGPEGDNTHVTTARVGTEGYAAPEYVETGHLRKQSDIYSFGVVLYEIITGRRTVERMKPSAEKKLLEWVKLYPVNSKSFMMIVDSKLQSKYPVAMVRRVAKLADHCLKKNDTERPTMAFVVESLSKIIEESNTGDMMSSVGESTRGVTRA